MGCLMALFKSPTKTVIARVLGRREGRGVGGGGEGRRRKACRKARTPFSFSFTVGQCY